MSNVRPSSPNSSSPVTFWICGECDFIVIGDHPKACEHLKKSPNWSHKLYEFITQNAPQGGFPYRPTGRSTHSSDTDPQVHYINTNEPQFAFEAIARIRFTNPLVSKAFAK